MTDTTSSPFRPAAPVRPARPTGPAAHAATTAVTASVTLVAGVVRWSGPPPDGYSAIFAPPWVAPVAAGLALLAVATARGHSAGSRRTAVLGGAAVVLLFWAAGGLALDAFRAFFAVTGIPAGDFSVVDVPGALVRSLAAVTAVVTTLSTWSVATAGARPVRRRWPRVLGLAMCVPYPALKAYWWLGGTLGRPEPHTGGAPVMEVALFATAAVLVLALTHRPVPGRVLRATLRAGGWVAASAGLTMGALMVFGTAAQLLGMDDGPVELGAGAITVIVALTYGTWLVIGVALLVATLDARDAAPRPALRGAGTVAVP
jgi:hypothetical protein